MKDAGKNFQTGANLLGPGRGGCGNDNGDGYDAGDGTCRWRRSRDGGGGSGGVGSPVVVRVVMVGVTG